MLPPDEIERESRRRIAALAPAIPEGWTGAIVQRILYAAGDPSLLRAVRISDDFSNAAVDAVRRSAPIVADVTMLSSGISRPLLERSGCRVVCLVNDPEIAARAKLLGVPRAALATVRAVRRHPGCLLAIGNAPTALLGVMDEIDARRAFPAAIAGIPVGMVAAAESKALLAERSIPYATVLGTRGGTAIAVSIVNTILRLALGEDG
jgi:precorrin-8X/cobalt-precorrin-8 methylmutase